MIDGIKMSFYDSDFLHKIKGWGVEIWNGKRGAILCKYRFLSFRIYPSGRVEIKGSLHKYWKGNNHSDFNEIELHQAITHFCILVGKSPNEIIVNNIEFGVNISPSFPVFEFCERLLAYRNEVFNYMDVKNSRRQIGFSSIASQYKIKCYDKIKQCPAIGNIYLSRLRFEVKVTRMEFLKVVGIKTLEDLKNHFKMVKLGTLLEEIYSRIIVLEDVDRAELTKSQRRNYEDAQKRGCWATYTPKKRYKEKTILENTFNVHSKTKMKQTVKMLISDKLQGLAFKQELGEDLPLKIKGQCII